ncbi:unnamed protein product, partial [Phaeothamnion confervicola]
MRGRRRGRHWRCRSVLQPVAAATLGALYACGVDGGLVMEQDGKEIWATFPADGDSTPLAPECSFRVYDMAAPNLTLPATTEPDAHFPRGRRDPSRSYIGMKMWTSRGDMDARRAVLAMLGDGGAYYESPLFTAYKLLALGRVHELSRKVFRSTGNWQWQQDDLPHGYGEFWAEITARAFDRSYMGRFPRAADEAEAAALAAALMDDLFFGHSAAEIDRKFLANGKIEDPYFLVFSMLCYAKATVWYAADPKGYNLLILDPEARDRGLDGGYYKLREKRRTVLAADAAAAAAAAVEAAAAAAAAAATAATAPAGEDTWAATAAATATAAAKAAVGRASAAAAVASAELTEAELRRAVARYDAEVCDCGNADYTETVTPGYHRPEHIAGIEFEGHSLYRVRAPAPAAFGGEKSLEFVVAVDASARGVIQREPDGPFYFTLDTQCSPDRDYCGACPVYPQVPWVNVRTAALIYRLPEAEDHYGSHGGGDGNEADGDAVAVAAAEAAEAAAAAMKEAAHALLARLNPEWVGRRGRRGSQLRGRALADDAHGFLLRLHGLRFSNGSGRFAAVMLGADLKPHNVSLDAGGDDAGVWDGRARP